MARVCERMLSNKPCSEKQCFFLYLFFSSFFLVSGVAGGVCGFFFNSGSLRGRQLRGFETILHPNFSARHL